MRKKAVSPAHRRAVAQEVVKKRGLFATGGLPHSAAGAFDVTVSRASPDAQRRTVKETALGTVGGASALRVSADRGPAAP